MKARLGIPVTITGLGLGYLIIALKAFYPYHRIIVLILSVCLSVVLFLTLRSKWLQLKVKKETVAKRILALIPYYLILKTLLYLAYATLLLTPIKETPLMDLSNDQLLKEIELDLNTLDQISIQLDTLSSRFKRDFQTSSSSIFESDQKEQISFLWADFMALMNDLDRIKNRYKGFYQLDYNTRPIQHANAFFIAMNAFVIEYQSILWLIRTVDTNHAVISILNEESEISERNSFFQLQQWITQPDAMLQLNAGAAYLSIIKNDLTIREPVQKKLHHDLLVVYQSLGNQPELFVENPIAFFEHSVSESWMPIQKVFARQINALSQNHQSSSISSVKLRELSPLLKPGDILLIRRNWHIVHIDLPGFWHHAAMVVDTIRIKDSNRTESELIQASRFGVERIPISTLDTPNYLAVLRPTLNEQDIQQAIHFVQEQIGKPYDDQLDYATDNAFMSAELIAKAYQHVPDFSQRPDMIQGRYVLSPNSFAENFDLRFGDPNQMTGFVLYWDGSNKKPEMNEEGLLAFRQSWKRPKWTLLQELGGEFIHGD
ncbi:YiiX/YebB-like N1pC/P60 family cysteine hydrolase [bacterium]